MVESANGGRPGRFGMESMLTACSRRNEAQGCRNGRACHSCCRMMSVVSKASEIDSRISRILRSRRRGEVASRSRMDTVDRRLARCKAKRVCLEAFCHRRPLDRWGGTMGGQGGGMARRWVRHDGGYTQRTLRREGGRAAGRMEEASRDWTGLDWTGGFGWMVVG